MESHHRPQRILVFAFFAMGVKVVAPIVGVYVVWPVIALPAVVAVAPFLLGCAVQFAFELHLDKRQSSCWPVLPIIFEILAVVSLWSLTTFLLRLFPPGQWQKTTEFSSCSQPTTAKSIG
ncbi:hypothetical protein M5K25_013362 [Dendrobium thyrsiflorum]|uniref:Uncharacterized protein n=1 Tax=Dendrobium thyrsiflorum TaxID=117978 RepID=A0ABD0USZ5_DENTH